MASVGVVWAMWVWHGPNGCDLALDGLSRPKCVCLWPQCMSACVAWPRDVVSGRGTSLVCGMV